MFEIQYSRSNSEYGIQLKKQISLTGTESITGSVKES